MQYRIWRWFTCIILLTSGVLLLHSRPAATVKPFHPIPPTKPALRVVLVPLDSRPPCTQFVQQLGAMANFSVITPPENMLDHYNRPADKDKIKDWLLRHMEEADAAIISVDMLTHGGLMASRLPAGSAVDYQETLAFLASLHQQYPHVNLYVFSIIPRLILADTEENRNYQQLMATYSQLRDEIDTFENPNDVQKLNRITSKIPAPIIERYHAMYAANTTANLRLIDMAASGVIHTLVIGQDDTQPFGLANEEKRRLDAYLSHYGSLKERVFITRGTDEVALTMLGNMGQAFFAARPHVYVEYSSAAAPYMIMPYMPHTVARTVQEKAALLHLPLVSTPEDADILLYVHIGTQHTTPQQLTAAALRVKKLLDSGKPVAVVDLSQDYRAADTLLPALLSHKIPVARLAAYAGWNTTSNSVGTALTQVFLYTASQHHYAHSPQALLSEKSHLEFLFARFLDDWYYQKQVQRLINQRLAWTDTDPNHLNERRQAVEELIKKQLLPYSTAFFSRAFAGVTLPGDNLPEQRPLLLTGMNITVSLPWERTFEIKVTPTLSLGILQQTEEKKQTE